MRHESIFSDDFYERLGLVRGAGADAVKQAYKQLLRRFPPERAPEEFKRIREAYETLGNERSRREYEARPDPIVQAWFATALHAMKEDDHSVAERYLKQILIQSPELDFVRNLLGLCFLYQNDGEKALRQFEYLLKRPHATAAWFGNAGHAFHLSKRYKEAESAFIEAIRRAKDEASVDYYVALADVLMDQQKFDEARTILEAGIRADNKIDFQDLRLFTKLLELHIRRKDRSSLDAELQRIETIAVDDEQRAYVAWKLGSLAQTLIVLGGFDYAIVLSELARKLQPLDADYTALSHASRLLKANKFAEVRSLIRSHASFQREGWLSRLATEIERYCEENRSVAELEPITSAPTLYTINGVGSRLYGQRDTDLRTGTYVSTLWFRVLFIPIWPISAYRVRSRGDNAWNFLGKTPLESWQQKYRIAVAIVAAFLLVRGMMYRDEGVSHTPVASSTFDNSSSGSTYRGSSGVVSGAQPTRDSCLSSQSRLLISGTERRPPRVGGLGSLQVHNGTSDDAVLVLLDAVTNRPVRAMFVRSGERSAFTRVSEGTFRVQYAFGEALNASTWRFCHPSSFGQFDDVVRFDEIKESGGTRYSTYSLTLHPVSGGTASTTHLASNEFVLPP